MVDVDDGVYVVFVLLIGVVLVCYVGSCVFLFGVKVDFGIRMLCGWVKDRVFVFVV